MADAEIFGTGEKDHVSAPSTFTQMHRPYTN